MVDLTKRKRTRKGVLKTEQVHPILYVSNSVFAFDRIALLYVPVPSKFNGG